MAEHVEVTRIRPDATDEEAAAVVGALQLVRPAGGVPGEPDAEITRWRFSGRWWTKPVALRRDRPW